ncbi:4-alpha-glucanotransferase [Glaciecola siphonariae]|uniref:4-alpha-glucanotransferase n=1 Tax=Glaciecola siphonariae TaxID=521012 RepID=A0ABV9LVL5_9ALTE
MMSDLLTHLVEQRGIGTEFIDAWGKPAAISRENQEKLLKTMGYPVDDEASLISFIENEAALEWLTPLNAVYVFRLRAEVSVIMRCAIADAALAHSIKITTEQGAKHTVKFVPVDSILTASQDIDDVEWQQYSVVIPDSIISELGLGYHKVALYKGRKKLAASSLILAPQRCFIPKEIEQGKKLWGYSVQLYCLRSERNWGIGDFRDLRYLAEQAAKLGADFIGLNPIHQLYPANPDACSPYGPSSRRWLNYLYIDVEGLACFDSRAMQQWMKDENVEQKLVSLRGESWVNYEGVAELKLAALRQVFSLFQHTYLNKQSKQKKLFDAFIADGGESLQGLAIFEALQMHLKEQNKEYWGWPVFPKQYQSADMPAVKRFARKYSDDVLFFMFLQWQAQIQFDAASKAATDAGMLIGLYRDLAVGVSDGSAEIWSNKELYCTDVSVGAPPDILGPLGQKWGLPPMDPAVLVNQQYQPIIDMFSSNMKASGALRIDHAMALLRLWWVHNEDDASEGVYVNYPVDDLLAILALESQRNQSLVIGEDLGTVPDAIREKLQENGVYSYRVFFFEQAEDGGFFSPSHYPEQSMATLTTHDMPTLIGYWHCDDLNLGRELGLYPDEEVLQTLFDSRHENKQHILDTLHGHHAISDDVSRDVNYVGMSRSLNFGMQKHMATGSSALLSLQLEDWLEMDKPVNIPGTFNEYPNWKRKLSQNLEEIFARHELQSLASELTDRRKKASQQHKG